MHIVSANKPARPRWAILYLALSAVAVCGTAFQVTMPGRIVDLVCGLAFFVILAGWIHAHRIALRRLDEPDTGAGRPRVRMIRSRRRGAHERISRDPDERIVLPFD